MNTEQITHAARTTLVGGTPFPVVVALLLEAGVESYHVDYLSLLTTFYDGTGGTVQTPIPYEGLPPVARDFDAAALVVNIRDSQQKNQSYRDFTTRAMTGGVAGYHAFLRGRRVTYYGRQGDSHTEWFPGD